MQSLVTMTEEVWIYLSSDFSYNDDEESSIAFWLLYAFSKSHLISNTIKNYFFTGSCWAGWIVGGQFYRHKTFSFHNFLIKSFPMSLWFRLRD